MIIMKGRCRPNPQRYSADRHYDHGCRCYPCFGLGGLDCSMLFSRLADLACFETNLCDIKGDYEFLPRASTKVSGRRQHQIPPPLSSHNDAGAMFHTHARAGYGDVVEPPPSHASTFTMMLRQCSPTHAWAGCAVAMQHKRSIKYRRLPRPIFTGYCNHEE